MLGGSLDPTCLDDSKKEIQVQIDDGVNLQSLVCEL